MIRRTVTAAFVEHEWKTQVRSMRFVALALAYVGLGGAGPWILIHRAPATPVDDLASVTFGPSPFLTLLFAAVIAYDGVAREKAVNAFAVTSLGPLSAAGYMGRRLLALLTVILPLTLLPPLSGLAAALYAEAPIPAPQLFFWTWLFRLVSVAILCATIALAAGSITGSLAGAGVLVLLALMILNSCVGWVLDEFGTALPQSGMFLGLDSAIWLGLFRRGEVWVPPSGGIAAEPGTLLEVVGPEAAIPLAMASLLFAVSTLYFSRTRPDIRPFRIRPDHTLRTFLGQWNRLRLAIVPDPRPSWKEGAAILFGIAALAGGIAWVIERDVFFRDVARERYRVEISGAPEPTSRALHPLSARVEGRVAEDGRVETTGSLAFENRGSAPIGHLALELEPPMVLRRLRSDGRSLTVSRTFDRIAVAIDPPLEPGARMVVEWEIDGTPSHYEFLDGYWRIRNQGFVQYWEWMEQSEVPRPMANSRTEKLATPSRAFLEPRHLFPVPRYTSWQLTPPPITLRGRGREVPPETHLPPVDLTVDLRVPFFALDGCGHVVVAPGGKLEGSCRAPLGALTIVGGRLAVLEDEEKTAALYLPAEWEMLVESRFPALVEAAALARESWPELLGESRALFVLLESTPAMGRLIPVEPWMLYRARFDVRMIARRIVGRRLLSLRPVAVDESAFFASFYGFTMGSDASAAIRPFRSPRTPPLLEESVWNADRMIAPLAAHLEYRVGSRRLRDAVRTFVAREGVGTARELFALIEQETGEPLERFYEDFVAANDLPELDLVTVDAARSSDRWIVTGTIRNEGSGETVCPVVLETDFERSRTTVRVAEGETVPFEISSPHRPRSVVIDPDGVCYRQDGPGLRLRQEVEP